MLRFIFAVLFCLSFLPGCSGNQYIEHIPAQPAKQQTINWHEHLNTALVISTASEKPALLYFYLEDCPACKLMEMETLSDPEVAHFINDNFIPIKINANQEDMVDRFGVDEYPKIIILFSLNPSAEISTLSGAVDSQSLIEYLKLSKTVDGALSTEHQLNKMIKDLLNLR